MKIEPISRDYSISGQIAEGDLRIVAQAGYKSVVCIRPDNEISGQPRFDDIARTAHQFGMRAAYIPVSGSASNSQLRQFNDLCQSLPKPVLGYCNSGARALSIYNTSHGRA
ncbi:MAG: TIGR01244 family phosphatase [Hyphomicrobiaceae bacterium]|nr:TIGR01244 family phosphatase [Hyphomicrobiaceae bacterium]